MNEPDLIKGFASLLNIVDEPPPSNVQALGHLMREWLQNVIADEGTGIDTGGGFSNYDLWVKMGGEELLITISKNR